MMAIILNRRDNAEIIEKRVISLFKECAKLNVKIYPYVLDDEVYMSIYEEDLLYYDKEIEAEVYDIIMASRKIERDRDKLEKVLNEIVKIPCVEFIAVTNAPGLSPYWGPIDLISVESKIYSIFVSYELKTKIAITILKNLLYRMVIKDISCNRIAEVITYLLASPFYDIREFINILRSEVHQLSLKEVDNRGIIISTHA